MEAKVIENSVKFDENQEIPPENIGEYSDLSRGNIITWFLAHGWPRSHLIDSYSFQKRKSLKNYLKSFIVVSRAF